MKKTLVVSESKKGFWSCECGKISRTYYDESLKLFCKKCNTKVVKIESKELKQKTLNDPYEVVEEKVSINNGKRFSWKKIFGKSLTDMITEIRKKNFSAEQTYQILFAELKTKGFDDTKMFDCLRTSVAARFAEQKTLEKRLKK